MKSNIFRRCLAAGLIMAVSLCALAAEQLTTVAVVDVAKVYTTFFKDSQAVRDLEKLKNSIQAQLDGYSKNLDKLRADRLKAGQDKNYDESLRLDKEIDELSRYVKEFKKQKQKELNDQKQNLEQSDVFYKELYAALKYVAEAGGYSLIMTSDNPYLLWSSTDVDVTDQVLDRLYKTVTPQ